MAEVAETAAPGAITLPPLEGIRREVWSLAWPVILAFGLDSILGLAAMLMIGRLGAEAVGAVGLASQVMWAVRAGIAAVGMGTVALIARFIGASDRDAAENVLRQSLLFGVVVSTLLAIPIIVFARPAMYLFQIKGPMAEMGARYLQIVMLAEPFLGVFWMCAAALRGAGDTRTPLWVGAIVDLVGIVLNYVLIFGKFGFPALGVDGSALATVIAISLGGVIFLFTLSMKRGVLRLRWRRFWPDFDIVRRILRVGYPAAVEQLVIQLGFVAFVAFVARYGEKEVAAYFIGVRILALSFLPGFGFSAAAATLVGQGLGARNREFSRRAGWDAVKLAVAMMTGTGVVIFAFAAPIAALFIDDPEVIAFSVTFMYALAAAQPLMAIDWTLTGGLRGAGDSRFPLFASLIGFYGLRLALTIVILLLNGSIIWIWWSLLADYLVRSALKVWRFRGGRWAEVEV